MKKQASKPKNWIRYYDDRDIFDEIADESVDMILDEHLRDDILSASVKGSSKTSQSRLIHFRLKQLKNSPP